MVQSYTLSQRPDLCSDKDNDNEDIIMLPDNMFLNLIDTNLQEKIAMSNDLDGNAGNLCCGSTQTPFGTRTNNNDSRLE